MQTNAFGKISRFSLVAAEKEGKTSLRDICFTAPYKMMSPFEKKDGSIEVMLMTASAGIMEGDQQEFSFRIRHGAKLEFCSQSYDKIHQMKEEAASRNTEIQVEKGGEFIFHPQPVIPFGGSAFHNRTKVFLEDETSSFFMSEILSAGRVARGERFAYRAYTNLTEIYRKENLIYRDNTCYMPERFPMEEMGMYEGFTHLLNLFLTCPREDGAFVASVRELLEENQEAEGAVTRLRDGDFVVRALGYRAQVLEDLSHCILEKYRHI